MPLQDCRPSYVKAGTYIPASLPIEPATAPSFIEKRSRLLAGGTFFRSKYGSAASNLIEVEYETIIPLISYKLNVYVEGILKESFGPASTNDDMRTLVNITGNIGSPASGPSEFIEMPLIDYNAVSQAIIDATGDPPYWEAMGGSPILHDGSITPFLRTVLTGGDGPPTDDNTLSTFYTGPERSIVIIQLTEIVNNDYTDIGTLDDPISPHQKVLQWNGASWIPYIPNSDCI